MPLANYITFSRVIGAVVVPVLLVFDVSRPVVFLTYVLFALTDVVDGYISRLRKSVRDDLEGDIFDPVADKALFICTLFVLISLQDVPKLASSIIILREIIVLGLRASAERHRFHIKSSALAKLKTFTGNLAVASYILKGEYLGLSAEVVGDVFLIICFALSLISGAQYVTLYTKKMQEIKRSS